jgi:hypothetical protein
MQTLVLTTTVLLSFFLGLHWNTGSWDGRVISDSDTGAQR